MDSSHRESLSSKSKTASTHPESRDGSSDAQPKAAPIVSRTLPASMEKKPAARL